MTAFKPDPNSSVRVNEIMRQAYDYLENTSTDKKRRGIAKEKTAKAVRRNPIKCGKARIHKDNGWGA